MAVVPAIDDIDPLCLGICKYKEVVLDELIDDRVPFKNKECDHDKQMQE